MKKLIIGTFLFPLFWFRHHSWHPKLQFLWASCIFLILGHFFKLVEFGGFCRLFSGVPKMPRQGPNEPNRVLKRSFVAILDWFNTGLLEKVLIIFRSSVFDKIWSRNMSAVLSARPVSGFTAYCPLKTKLKIKKISWIFYLIMLSDTVMHAEHKYADIRPLWVFSSEIYALNKGK